MAELGRKVPVRYQNESADRLPFRPQPVADLISATLKRFTPKEPKRSKQDRLDRLGQIHQQEDRLRAYQTSFRRG
jgi:hypothetical protein